MHRVLCKSRTVVWLILCFAGLLVLMALASPLSVYAARQSGRVRSGDKPIAFARVTLYRARDDRAKPLVALGRAQSDADGYFEISYKPPSNSSALSG